MRQGDDTMIGVKTSTFLKGFTLVEIALAVLIVTILAAITIPVLSRIRMDMNEAAAIKSIRTLTTAMENWRVANGSYYPVTLNRLGSANPAYIDRTLGCNSPTACVKQWYVFFARGGNEPTKPGDRNVYFIMARPLTQNVTGRRYFCATEDGVIKYSYSSFIFIANYTVCKGLSAIMQ